MKWFGSTNKGEPGWLVVAAHGDRLSYVHGVFAPSGKSTVTRFGDSVLAMKLGLLAFDAATIAILLALLRRLGSPATRIAAYAWHPLPIWEIAGSGHVDIAMCALLMAGLLLFLQHRVLLAGVVVTLGALVKPTALLALPVLWRPWNWRRPLMGVRVRTRTSWPTARWKCTGRTSGRLNPGDEHSSW